MTHLCKGCNEIVVSKYCQNCDTENDVILDKDIAYNEREALIAEGNNIKEARRQDCLEHRGHRFQDWNDVDNRNNREIEKARKKYESLR